MSARQEVVEEAFLQEGICGWLHRPAQRTAQGCGVLLCGPFAAAPTGTYRNWRLFAMLLARAGFLTLRFDYPGTGNSAECAGGERIGTWIETIKHLAGWLRQHEGLREVALCGLRFGALLAAEAAGGAQPLVLLAPPLSGRAYLRELTLTSHSSKAWQPAAAGLEANGLCLNQAEIAALARMEYRRQLQQGRRPVLWLGPGWERSAATLLVPEQRISGARINLELFEGLRNFMLPAYSAEFPAATFAKVPAWLRSLAHGGITQRGGQRAMPVLHLPGGIEERRIHFGRDGGLFAIETRPARVNAHLPAVLILNSGAEPHTGHSRMNVLLARRLAAAGRTVLRIDLSGLGDSRRARLEPMGPEHHSEARLAWLRSYRPAFINDALDAVDLLAGNGYHRCVLAGLCSGANLALHAALRDARVAGLVLINPTFVDRDLVDAMPRAAPAPDGALRPALRRGFSALGLNAKTRRRLRDLGRWLVQEARWATALLLRRETPLDNPARWLWRLRQRNVAVLAIASEGDQSLRDWRLYAGRVWPRAGGARRMPIVMKGQSHSFEPIAMRDTLIEHVCAHLSRPDGGAS